MNRKLKALGLALVAALALTAVMATAASAQFTSTSHHTIITGSQKTGTNDVFTAGEGFGGITCENVTFSGTSSVTSSEEQVITPSYSGCKDSFGRTVDPTVTITLRLTWKPLFKFRIDISGHIIFHITSGGSTVCTVTIGAQNEVNGGSFTNLGGTNGMELTTHATNVKNTTSGGFFNCGISNGEHTNGTYDGTAVVTGKDTSGAAVSISGD